MPALTDTDIANMALAILTEASIDSLDEDVKAARLLNLHYDVVRETELMLNTWSFAILFPDDIAAVDTGQDGEFQYLYEVPSDFLRPAWLTYDGKPDGEAIRWTKWSDGIRSNFSGPLKMPYVANLIDPNDFDALFTKAFAAALAVPVAHALTGKASMVQVAQQAYEKAIADARRVNSFMKIGRVPELSWLARRGDTRRWR
jgi:hypothetical protein